jgi:hypothetical protein
LSSTAISIVTSALKVHLEINIRSVNRKTINMVIFKICFGILICWVLHIVVLAEDADVSTNKSINIELSSAVSNSVASSGEVNNAEFRGTDRDKQHTKKKESPQELPTEVAPSISASNDTENSAEFGAKEDEGFKIKDPVDSVYKECKGRLSCIERRLVVMIDRLDAVKTIPMFAGYVTIEKTSEEVPAEDVIADSYVALLSRVDRYLKSHSVRVHLPETEEEIQRHPGRFLQEKILDFNLGTLATNDASEGQYSFFK